MATHVAIVDTMVLGALIQPGDTHPAAPGYRQRIGDRAVLISFVTLAEIRYGALKANWGEFRRRGLERDLARFTVVQPDDALITRCAELRDVCERRGHPLAQKVHDADRWIAATALRLDAVLVSDDGIFRDVPALTLA